MRRLFSEKKALGAIVHHLVGSTYHPMEVELAKMEADMSEIKIEAYESDNEICMPSAAPKNGQGRGRLPSQ